MKTTIRNVAARLLWVVVPSLLCTMSPGKDALAQIPDIMDSETSDAVSDGKVETMFHHSLDGGKLYLAGQINFIDVNGVGNDSHLQFMN